MVKTESNLGGVLFGYRVVQGGVFEEVTWKLPSRGKRGKALRGHVSGRGGAGAEAGGGNVRLSQPGCGRGSGAGRGQTRLRS